METGESKRVLCKSLFFINVWSLWFERNQLKFNNRSFLILYCLAQLRTGSVIGLDDMLLVLLKCTS